METKKKVTHAPTPGPWRYEEVTKTIRSVPSNYWLATMDSWDGAINNEANARLIAAAPELLEAAKRMLEIFKEFPATPEIQKHFSNAFRGNIEDAMENAIAKAEGRE